MRPPELQPVYLVVPSIGARDSVAGFVDALAVDPTLAERVLLSVTEYSTFVDELLPLGDRLEAAARVAPSGFTGLSYASAFDGLARLLAYDRYRLAEDGVRIGRPLVVVIVHAAPSIDDSWHEGHRALVDDERAAPVVVAVVTDPSAESFAAGVTFPTQRIPATTNPLNAGEAAASIVIDTFTGGLV